MNHEAPQFLYNFDIGPTIVPPDTFLKQVVEATPNDVLELNCQLFATAVTKARGFDIPDHYRSSEHYFDPENKLTDIPAELAPKLAQSGDIVGLSGHPRANPKNIHLAVVKENKKGTIQLVHAAKDLQTVGETPLEEIMTWEYHETLRFVKRPITVFEGKKPNTTALRKLKFLS